MQNSSRPLALFFVLSILAILPLRAETVSYPEDKPAFTVNVPEGWQTARKNGSLMLATNADVVVSFQHVTDVHEDAEAKTGLKVLSEQAGKTFGMSDAEVVTPASPMQVGTFKGFAAEYKGKDKDGERAFWQCLIFAPQKGDYYLATIVCSDKDDKKTAPDRESIIKSIKPME